MQVPACFPLARLVAAMLLLMLLLPWRASTFAAPSSLAVDTYHWPPGVFLSFHRLQQAQKDRLLSEIETKLAGMRQAGKSLLVKGELLMKVQPEVAEYNPATILDQSGLVVIVHHFPNIYYKFQVPAEHFRRHAAFVMKNPQVDRAESTLRQAVVLRGEFFGFSQTYINAITDSLEKALAAPNPANQATIPGGRNPAKKKKP
ncbi:MAG: hypothetical protein ACUVRZ_08725 [Desulfobacca sp.]|uniref:hypothetical protein n=1 Tax=Desulfobacca sp. TaxID=2067990 RepID=UPI00404B7B36